MIVPSLQETTRSKKLPIEQVLCPILNIAAPFQGLNHCFIRTCIIISNISFSTSWICGTLIKVGSAETSLNGGSACLNRICPDY